MKRSILACAILLVFSFLSAQTPFLVRNSQYLGFDGNKIELPNGNTMIFWNDTSSGSSDIMAQKISPSGSVLWANPRVVASGSSEQRVQSIVLTSDAHVGVLYYEYSRTTGAYNYRAQKFSQAGQPLWGAQGIQLVDDDSYYSNIRMVPNGMGGVYAVYRSGNPSPCLYGLNLDATGTNLWPHIPMPSFDSVYNIEAIADGCGGIIVNSWVYLSGEGTHCMLTRFDEAGDVIGTNPLINPDIAIPGEYNVIMDKTGNIIMYHESSTDVQIQKMDVNGNLLLPAVVHIPIPEQDYPNQYILQASPGGGAVLAYMAVVNTDNHYLRVISLGSDMQPTWASPVSFTLTSASNHMSIDTANGFWCSWLTWASNGYYSNATVYCGKINTDGSIAVAPMSISSDLGYKMHPVLKSTPGNALIVWNDQAGDTNGFREQVVTNGGNQLLPAGGRIVYSVLNGGTELRKTVTLGMNTLHIYDDTRANWEPRLYYQLTNAAGNPMLTAGGKALNPGATSPEKYLDSKWTANNTALVLYTNYTNSTNYLWLQEISAGGFTLYPGFGLCIAQSNESDFNGSLLGKIESDNLVVWPVMLPDGYGYAIWGQRISGGVIQWPEGGKTLLSSSTHNLLPKALQGDYLVYTSEDYQEWTTEIKAFRIGNNGDPASGWTVDGLSLYTPDLFFTQYQYSGLVDGKLVVFARASDYVTYVSKAQMVSPTGQLLWGANGVVITETDDLNETDVLDVMFGNELTYLIYGQDSEQMCVNKLNQAGNKLWGTEGILIGGNSNFIREQKLVQYSNGTFSVVYINSQESNAGLYKIDIANTGEVLTSAPQSIIEGRAYLTNIMAAPAGDSAILAWNDVTFYDRGEALYLSSLWDCRIDAFPVSNEDNLMQPVVNNARNYPNPFRGNTTISFGLKDPSPVQVDIYNLRGQHVRSLMNEAKAPGNYEVNWDGKNKHGMVAADGVYFFKIQAGTFSSRKKMILLK